ncbi:thioredoxin family protein [Desulfatitalea alkaliphila]|uniref:Thioredoxin family protein n=1 Tax=Desulfatitalea alkaliphila TaxID=2929485 RepID=A0AA41UIN0_9BACT|nr:thioredoxin family protein [Desulfatitalea alkaliphila]MCJ8499722.1 thioredoxin family protein [Desulfatitalea alkaliphila]
MGTNSRVKWLNDYDAGLEACRERKKPMFLDFFKDG